GGSGGSDSADLTGSSGADTLTLVNGNGGFIGTGFAVALMGIDTVNATGGATDLAYLYDAGAGTTSTFTAGPTTATLAGPTYSNTANNFALVEAYATPGSDDTATLTGDTAAANVFVGAPTFAYMTHAADVNYLNVPLNFKKVIGVPGTANDTAQFYGSAMGIN